MLRVLLTASLLLSLAPVAGCLPWRTQQQQTPGDSLLDDEAPVSFTELSRLLLKHDADFGEFMQQGPMRYWVRENQALRVGGGNTVVCDNLIPASASPTPLVIIVHGNHSQKEAHRYQAERLASFGIHTIVLQVPNRSRWMQNGKLLARLVKRLSRAPGILGGDVDPGNIILVGHSFGGSAVTVAMGNGAPARGLILLDPAVVSTKVKKAMKGVKLPVILLGADKDVFRSRKRRLFYRHVQGEIAEVSIKGATHDDAQFPSMYSLSAFGFDPFTSLEKQELFAAALTASAFSIGATGGLDYAWGAFGPLSEQGLIKNAKRRASRTAKETPKSTTRSAAKGKAPKGAKAQVRRAH